MAETHSHNSSGDNRAFKAGISLNLVFIVVEAGFGFRADSLALIADAGHNLSDVLSLFLAWGAAALAARASTSTRTYGFRKLTIMAPLASALLLLVALGGISWEAVGRFFSPKDVDGPVMIIVALIGVAINTATALMFFSGRKEDLNLRGVFLHMAADAGISLGVAVAGLIILLKGWLWVDPVISLAVALVILAGTWGLFRDSMNLAIDAVPREVDISGIRAYLTGLDGVESIHDLHVWAMSTTEIALTVHLVVKHRENANGILPEVQRGLKGRFGIEHSTIQMESLDDRYECLLDNHTCP